MTTKQLDIRAYYFYNDLINVEDFNPKNLKLCKNESTNLGIYYPGYVNKKTS